MPSIFTRAILCGCAIAASPAGAQVAPVPYWAPGGPFGFVGAASSAQGGALGLTDEDGNPKGFSFRSFNYPVSAFGSGYAWGGLGAFGNGGGLNFSGAQYGYSFKGLGDMPVTMFGSVSSLRSAPDVFTSLVTPGFERSNTLATSVNAGIAFNPTSNVSLSFSAGYVQPSATADTDLRSRLISGGLR